MTDREKFQKTFSKLHASPDLLTEVVEMAEEKQVITKKRRYGKTFERYARHNRLYHCPENGVSD